MSAPKGVISLSGRDYPTWPFVLDKAHSMGLLSIETELMQIPSEENGKTAIVRAVATFVPATEGGPLRRFSGIGDAGPHNVNPKIAGATLRMAETRAMGRALRTGTNIGETMYEELPDMSEERAAAPPSSRPVGRYEPNTPSGDAAMAGQGRVAYCSSEGCGVALKPAEVTFSERKYGKHLCRTHQREEAAHANASR